ncbi:MAG: hypothetical protein XXXJIFNMEKO3_02397 [Candidatus Erwinia impunctatus]|nr:hypothetical protein XXXJIFNMEKO_02397 [Culicoides impunctatus]
MDKKMESQVASVPPRRRFLQRTLSLIPLAAVGGECRFTIIPSGNRTL